MLRVYLSSALLLLLGGFIVFRVIVRRDYRRGRLSVSSIILETVVFYAHAHFTLIFLPADWPAVRVSAGVAGVGWSLVVLGLAIVMVGMIHAGVRNIFGQKGSLKQEGLYRFSRNPQIVGYGIFVVGIAVLWASWYSLGWVGLYVGMAHMMVTTEEEFLRQIYGPEYQSYCARVPRYLGLPGKHTTEVGLGEGGRRLPH